MLNDPREAEARLHQAAMVENIEDEEGERPQLVGNAAMVDKFEFSKGIGDGRSTTTSNSESARVKIAN